MRVGRRRRRRRRRERRVGHRGRARGEVAGTPAQVAWADAVAGVCVAAARVAPEAMHRLPLRLWRRFGNRRFGSDTRRVSHEARRDAAPGRRAPLPRVRRARRRDERPQDGRRAVRVRRVLSEPTRRTSSLRRAANRLARADAWLSDAFASLAAPGIEPATRAPSSYLFDFNDPSLVRALASLVHAAWERGPPREPTRVSRRRRRKRRVVRDGVVGRGRDAAAEVRRRRLRPPRADPREARERVQARPRRYRRGVRRAERPRRAPSRADRRGECDAFAREILPLLAGSFVDACTPPPPPPDPAKSAPREHECVPPCVRAALYELLSAIVAAAPALAALRDARVECAAGKEHLRAMLDSPEYSIGDDTLAECVRVLLDACQRAALAEVVASCGHRGARARGARSTRRWRRPARTRRGSAPRTGVGSRRRTPPRRTRRCARAGAAARVGRRDGSRDADVSRAVVAPGGDSFDSSTRARGSGWFFRRLLRRSPLASSQRHAARRARRRGRARGQGRRRRRRGDSFPRVARARGVGNARRIRTVAVPVLRGCLGDDAAARHARTQLASAATELWTACEEPMGTFPIVTAGDTNRTGDTNRHGFDASQRVHRPRV